MGIVKISDRMHDQLRGAGEALSRSINAQAEHWLRVGMLAELHPGFTYADICQLLLRAARTGEDPFAPAASDVEPGSAKACATAAKAIRRAAR
jgi:hypothetical protein